MKKILALSLLLACAAAFACGGPSGGGNRNSAAVELENPGDTPTEAYKRLFAAVKSKNPDAIRKELSAKTREFARAVAARQKQSEEQVIANAFTATTFAESLPEIRDERVKDNMGAVEVWNSADSRWEDIPFVREKEGWKLAIGELFGGGFISPGKGRDVRERESSNTNTGTNRIRIGPPPGANSNGRPYVQVPASPAGPNR